MQRNLMLAALLTAVVSLGAMPAHAQTSPGPIVDGFQTGGYSVTDATSGDAGAGHGGGGGGGSSGPTVYTYYAIGWPNGLMCVNTYYTTDPAEYAVYEHNTVDSLVASMAGNGVTIGVCPPRPTAPDPGTLARDFWTVRVLPSPALKVVPDYGIVGKKVYLQIGGDRAKRFDVADPLGPPISIDATSTYRVDWGDSTIDTTTSHGGPYPDGDVTHAYAHDASSITITVTELWTASWSAGGAANPLPALQTQSTLPFRVEQVQAVGA